MPRCRGYNGRFRKEVELPEQARRERSAGLLGHSRHDVGVGRERDRRRRMPEEIADDLCRNPARQHEAGRSVSTVAQANPREVRGGLQLPKSLADPVGVIGPPKLVGDQVAVAAVRGAGRETLLRLGGT